METKTKWIIGLVATLLVTIGVSGAIINSLDYKRDLAEHNFETSQQELSETKLSNDQLLYEKQAYILNEKEMMEMLDISKKENKELKKKLSADAVYISKLEAKVQTPDTVYTVKDSLIYIDNTLSKVCFNYKDDPWLKLKGETDLITNRTSIFDVTVPLPLMVGMTEDYTIFVGTDNPYMVIGDVQAVALENYLKKTRKKMKCHWKFGIYAGWGVQYGILNKTLDTGPQVGIGAMFHF